MSFEQALDMTLAEAVGDDFNLVAELRGAFLDSAARHVEAMSQAGDDAGWQDSALRLKGLAASFGATSLMEQAGRAATGRRGDAVLMGDIRRGIAMLAL